jgi:hypothetical protein
VTRHSAIYALDTAAVWAERHAHLDIDMSAAVAAIDV